MKKLLVLVLVLTISAIANATVIDLVAVDLGLSGGRLGTNDTTDQLQNGDVIGFKLVLNHDDGSFGRETGSDDYSSYDGYVLDSMNLIVSADNGVMDAVGGAKGGGSDFGWHEDWTSPGDPAIIDNTLYTDLFSAGAHHTLGTTNGISPTVGGTADLLWGMRITADGVSGDISLSWGLDENGGGYYYDYIGDGFVLDPVLKEITLADLGFADGLGGIIYATPEPMSIALLGLGGLFLRRRK